MGHRTLASSAARRKQAQNRRAELERLKSQCRAFAIAATPKALAVNAIAGIKTAGTRCDRAGQK
jgi:hypothetical protein